MLAGVLESAGESAGELEPMIEAMVPDPAHLAGVDLAEELLKGAPWRRLVAQTTPAVAATAAAAAAAVLHPAPLAKRTTASTTNWL